MVRPAPSFGGCCVAVLRGRDAFAGPRPREAEPARGLDGAREPGAWREVEGLRGAEVVGPRRPEDDATGRLADRGAPGRLDVMPEGYNLRR